METSLFPTKGNLIAAKRSLSLAKVGYELMDKKRSILVREFMILLDSAKKLQGEINVTFAKAYESLQQANVDMGFFDDIAFTLPTEKSINVKFHSVMGVEIPTVTVDKQPEVMPYGLFSSSSSLDNAYQSFVKVKYLCVSLAETENSIGRLAVAIKKTQKRANALKNVIIPRFNVSIKHISEVLEEKEREEFTRLKVIKKKKMQ